MEWGTHKRGADAAGCEGPSPDNSDLALLARWRNGSAEAADELLERYFDLLHRFFANKASGAVEDLVQETLLRCAKSMDRFAERSSFKTFVLGIARHVLFAHYRSVQRRPQASDLEGEAGLHDPQTSPSAGLRRNQEHQRLLVALRRLPVDDQVVLELQYWDDLTACEIAEVMELPPTAVRMRLTRARKRVASALHAVGGQPDSIPVSPADFDAWRGEVRTAIFGPD